jgi:integrase/recombinase XerD
MLTPYRRHSEKCAHASKGRNHKNCKCPIWADGVLGNREVRVSLKTRDWNEASRKILRMEAEGRTGGRVALSTAWDSFIADLEARAVTPGTVKKYKLLRNRLEDYLEQRRILYVSDCTLDLLTSFRITWKYGPRTAAKHIERLRAFFRFCAERHWIDFNPALSLKPPKVDVRPTMPLTQEEMVTLLKACDDYRSDVRSTGRLNALRLKAIILLMRYSGMRIGDTVNLSAERIKGDKLFLYTQKTGQPVYTVLPPAVVQILKATPRMTDHLYFWNGVGHLKTAVKNWQKKIRKVFEKAQVDIGDSTLVSHRFRDTFSVELLLAGVPIERVSILLGHSSVRITERHYNPWVRSRQEQLEADLRQAWSRDPLQKGTNQVQSPSGKPN